MINSNKTRLLLHLALKVSNNSGISGWQCLNDPSRFSHCGKRTKRNDERRPGLDGLAFASERQVPSAVAVQHMLQEQQESPTPSRNPNVRFWARAYRCRTTWIGRKPADLCSKIDCFTQQTRPSRIGPFGLGLRGRVPILALILFAGTAWENISTRKSNAGNRQETTRNDRRRQRQLAPFLALLRDLFGSPILHPGEPNRSQPME